MRPHPANTALPNPLGILDVRAALLTAPPPPNDIVLVNFPPPLYLKIALTLGELYHVAFPERPQWADEPINWETDDDALEAVARFLTRVNEHLFPIYQALDTYELEDALERLYDIPVLAAGLDVWYDGWHDYKEPIPYLASMDFYHNQTAEHDVFAQEYPNYNTPRNLLPSKLSATLRDMELPEPLNALGDLIDMLDAATGNYWLDAGAIYLGETGEYPSWTRDNIVSLTAAWRQAEPILTRVYNLLDWKNNSADEVVEKLKAVQTALLDAYAIHKTKPRQQNHPETPMETLS